MNTLEYRIPSGEETLECSVDYSETGETPSVVCLHGGGPSDRNATRYLSTALQAVGKTVIRFDYSGQGDSTGQMQRSSLKKRHAETRSVLDHFGIRSKVTVIGSSMGGYVASSLVKEIDVDNLILFCPAAYDRNAWEVEFGAGFTEIIRQKDSYLKSDIGELLHDFKGRALFIIGAKDEVIPTGVIELYTRALSNCSKLEMCTIEDCPHPIHRWILNHPVVRKEVQDRVQRFLS